MTPRSSVARKLGAIAGLAPTLAIVLLFAASGSLASAGDVAISLGMVAVLSMAAGWFSGAYAARHGWVAAACVYGISWIWVQAELALVQAAIETWSASGADVVAIGTAVIGRAAYALVSALYFLAPAIALGVAWVATLRALTRRWSGGRRTDGPANTHTDQGAKNVRPGIQSVLASAERETSLARHASEDW